MADEGAPAEQRDFLAESGAGAAPGEREESLWEKVLREHRENSTSAKARDVYQMFIVGDRADGKDGVFKWLRLQEDIQADDEDEEETAAAGLSFWFGEWKEKAVGEDEESTVRILQTIVEKPSLQYLLPAYFLSGSFSQRNLESSLFAITVDLSAPHAAITRLNQWYTFLEKVVKESAGDDLDLPKRLQERMEMQCDGFHTDPRTVVKKEVVDDCLEVVSPLSPRDTGRASATYRKMGIFQRGNLGVPLIVVCTKAKALDVIASQQTKDPKEKEHFLNYVQGTLRRWALERGAALIYTDGDRASADMLKEYLLYRLANIPMSSMLDGRRQIARRVPTAATGHGDLFVPAFADSLGQVAKLQVGRYSDASWDQVMPHPKEATEVEAVVEVPDSFTEWLANEKKKSKDGGGLLGSTPVTRDSHTGYMKGLEGLRDRDKRYLPTKAAKSSTIEETAEFFFTNMIRTYKKQDGQTKKSRPRNASTAAAAAPAAPEPSSSNPQ
eukprot:TRINITY_DN14873_c0_g1_i1.p1 TRINITY_DN14873_c0_g1~~TRINITY_DN14873_c0_g1_i1.p1  ORF type:complete len:498 (+),score=186.18 TRINITY_DN14873_c0_g1_i1:229-1722(+)